MSPSSISIAKVLSYTMYCFCDTFCRKPKQYMRLETSYNTKISKVITNVSQTFLPTTKITLELLSLYCGHNHKGNMKKNKRQQLFAEENNIPLGCDENILSQQRSTIKLNM